MDIKSELNSFPNAVRICQLLMGAGGEVRFIGGCVRDILINRNPADIDLATNLIPDDIQNVLEKNKIKYINIGKEFGTIGAVINKQQVEITTLRKDLVCDGRYAQVQFTDDWQEDAKRRDFTINALSADIDGNVYDYFDGLGDLKQKRVRFIGNAEERITEDYLRILRFFRFSAYFSDSIDDIGLEASKKYVEHLKGISGYRIRSEMSKIFLAPKTIETLKVMEKEQILQEVISCNDASIKRLEKLCFVANEFSCKIDELLYWAVLINKKSFDLPLSREEKRLFIKLNSQDVTNWDYVSLKKYWQIYKQHFKSFILLNLAKSNVEIKNKEDLKKLFDIPIQELPVTGNDLLKLGVEPGKLMGELLQKAEEIWYHHEIQITKQDIISKLIT
jgi:poly(A) polymerase